MATPCPHCSQPVEGWVPLDRLEAAAKARDAIAAERDGLKATVKETQKKAALYDALEPEYARVKSELEAVAPLKSEMETLRKERVDAAYTSVGITDPKIRRIVELDFDEQKDADDGVKDIAAFLGKVKEAPPAHLAPFFVKPAAPPPPAAVATPGTPARPNVLPPPAAPAVPPPAAAKMTPQQAAEAVAAVTSKPLPSDPVQRAAAVLQRKADLAAIETAARGGVAT